MPYRHLSLLLIFYVCHDLWPYAEAVLLLSSSLQLLPFNSLVCSIKKWQKKKKKVYEPVDQMENL